LKVVFNRTPYARIWFLITILYLENGKRAQFLLKDNDCNI